MDTLLDNLIFLIPVAIFIGRIVTAAKNKEKDKKKPVPKWPDTRPAPQQRARPAVPEISIHFEDDADDEIPEFIPGPFPAAPVIHSASLPRTRTPTAGQSVFPPEMPVVPAFATANIQTDQNDPYAAYNSAAFRGEVRKTPVGSAFTEAPARSQGKKTLAGKSGAEPAPSGFPFNLGSLSPLKQAVVMAEVLGPPKGLL